MIEKDDDIGFSDAPYSDCKECHGRGYLVNRSENITSPCSCWKRDNLLIRIRKAGIPEEYIYSKMDDFDSNVQVIIYAMDDKGKEMPVLTVPLYRIMSDYIFELHDVKRTGKSLFFTGMTSVGKTTMACIILKSAIWYSVVSRKKFGDFTGQFITFKEYIDLVFKADRSEDENMAERLDYIRNIDFLVLDEVGAEAKKQGKTSDFFISVLDDILRHRSKWKLPTIITTNLNKEEFSYQYKQSGSNNINRVWSIIEGNYLIMEINCKKGNFRRDNGRKMVDEIVNRYKSKKENNNHE